LRHKNDRRTLLRTVRKIAGTKEKRVQEKERDRMDIFRNGGDAEGESPSSYH